ncbi:hypothetical protein AMAG_02005 [Allomyces macrogynus ATCC 38327]|uniref:Uncharacterized protein n=1 Tax=Allomyces macrogynus (strain ATCC 38327) TaxID=578462 RepID=A0A0L0S188_ALLM3|nr:hypothetical protein AMAG_02005 [Allomyces macrogynus ATCC 38327]|eukprot:KNE56170.1 hypothetical protein AMAG_02005 [Allomyces macrogynus ATCC 38327]
MLSHPPLSVLAAAPPAATATGASKQLAPAMVTGTAPTTAPATASTASGASSSASHAAAVGSRARMPRSPLVRFEEMESMAATTTPPPHALLLPAIPVLATAAAAPTPSPTPRSATPVIPLPRTPVLPNLRVPLHRTSAPTSPAGTTRSASSAAYTAQHQQQQQYATPPPLPLTLDQVSAVVQTARAFRAALHAVSRTGNDLARALAAVYRSRGTSSDADPSAAPPEKPARDMDVAFLAETLKVVGAAHQLLGDMVWRELEKPMDTAWNAIHEETLTQRTATDHQIAALRAQAAQAAAQATKLAKSRKEAKRNLAVHAHRQVAELDQKIAALKLDLRAIGDRTAIARRPVIVAASGRVAGRMLAGYVNAGLALRALAETSRRRAPVAGDTLPLLNRGVVTVAAAITQGRRSLTNVDGGADALGSVGRAAGTTVAPSPLVASQSLTSMASSRSSLSQAARPLPSTSTGSPLVELAAARRSLETAYGSRAVVPPTALASPARATSPLAFDGTASVGRSGTGTPPPQVVRQASSRASIWSMLSTSAVYGGGMLPDAAADAAPPPPLLVMGTPVLAPAAVP